MKLHGDALWVLIEMMPGEGGKEIVRLVKNSLSCDGGVFQSNFLNLTGQTH